MAVTLTQLVEWRDRLLDAKFSGVLEVRDSNGESVRYRSQAELEAALSSLDTEIRRVSGQRSPNSIFFNTSKGL